MSDSSGESKEQRARDARRKWRLGNKVKNGGTLTDDEKDWLARYNASVGKASPESSPEPPPDPAPSPESSPEPQPSPEPRVEFPAPDRVPTPPRATVPNEPSMSEDWRTKYRRVFGDGRESTCLVFAGAWYDLLSAMEKQTVAAGVEPLIAVESIKAALPLAVDTILPPHIRTTPELMAAAGTTTTILQRWLHRKKIAETQHRISEETRIQRIRESRAKAVDNVYPFPSQSSGDNQGTANQSESAGAAQAPATDATTPAPVETPAPAETQPHPARVGVPLHADKYNPDDPTAVI